MTDSDSQDIEMPDSDTVEYSNPPVLEISSPDEESLDLSDPELFDPELEDSELADFSSLDSLHSELSDPELQDSELVDLELIEQVSDLDLEDPEISFPSTPEEEPNPPHPAPSRPFGFVTQVWRDWYILEARVEILTAENWISYVTRSLDSVYALASTRGGLGKGSVCQLQWVKWIWNGGGGKEVVKVVPQISRAEGVFYLKLLCH